MKNSKELAVIIDNVRSAFNVGSIFRTSDGAGVRYIAVCGISPYPPHPKVLKTSLGSEDHIPWEYFQNTLDAIKKLKADGYTIMAIEQDSKSIKFDKIEYPEKLAIILGHEITGISKPVLDLCDFIVEIPMEGFKESLNVSTTAGIILFYIKYK